MDPVDDNRNYKFGVFYFNPDDERRLVPKRIRPFGFTLNFAHKDSILSLMAILLAIIILISLAQVLQ